MILCINFQSLNSVKLITIGSKRTKVGLHQYTILSSKKSKTIVQDCEYFDL